MKTIKLILCAALVLGGTTFYSCKTKAAASNVKTVMAENYRLIIAFISKGGGVDTKANEAILKFIEDHPKKPKLEQYRWGREGEIDFCLKLTELSTKEQKTFIEELQKLAGKSDLVQFSENAPAVHKK